MKLKEKKGFFICLTLLLLSCIVAWNKDLSIDLTPALNLTSELPKWPSHYQGKKITQLPLSKMETLFMADFPGKIGRFTDGQRQIIMRWIVKPSRKLHPAADCFRGMGYKISDLKISLGANEKRWRSFTATLNKENLQVYEQIVDANKVVFTDTSSWYWNAVFSQSQGPWLAVTVAERKHGM